MRARTAILGVLIALSGTAVHAQHAPVHEASAPAAATPAAPAAAVPTDAEPAAATAEPAPTTAANEPAAQQAAANEQARQAEWARLAQQRAEIQLMLARARAANAQAGAKPGQPVNEREPEPVRHGDAGAAFAFGLSADATWHTDPGYDVFADEDVTPRLGIWVGYDVAAIRDNAFLALELGWGTEHTANEFLGVADTELSTQLAYLGATLRWVPIDWLQPHLRIAGGAALVDAKVTAGTQYRDGATGVFKDLISPYGSLGAGFTLRTATRAFEDRHGKLASLSFGLMFEGGYTLAKSVDVALDGPGPSKRDISLAEPQLGTLERSGPYFRVSLVGRL